jgi:hypothetical protein
MIDSGTRRTLAELVTLYELEPNLSEVIAEGRCDAAVVLWFLTRSGIDSTVYCVQDRVVVPPADIRRRGLNPGRKGEVIAAALAIEEQSPNAAARVTFIYDIDDDVIADRAGPKAQCLFHTDYTSMEMYCWSTRPLQKLLRVPLRADAELDADAVIQAVRDSLLQVGFARLALSRIARPVAMVKTVERRCSVRSGVLRVDLKRLVADSLDDAGGAAARGVTVDGIVTETRDTLEQWSGDPRLAVRGHDFTRMLCFYLKTHHPSLFRDDRTAYKVASTFENLLVTCLEMGDLRSEPLFVALTARTNGQLALTG